LNNLMPLVRNEIMKVWRKKRFLVVVLILAALIPIFVYAQLKVQESFREQSGTNDWRIRLETQINDYENRLNSARIPEEWKAVLRVEVERLQFYLDRGIDPSAPSGVTFAREFAENAIGLFLPLMVMVVAVDLVSSEHASGAIKLLLTKPVRRWKVLASKYAAMTAYVTLTVLAAAALSYGISGAVFGYAGWRAPVLTGFAATAAGVDTTNVHSVEQWQYMLMTLGLVWFSCWTVGALSLMVSVLVRGAAAGMGIMLALLIAGSILSNMASNWEHAKYLFMVNLNTIAYLAGQLPPIPGMTLPFSLAVLAATAFVSVLISFGVFTRRDVLN